jgi:hypothetical protein
MRQLLQGGRIQRYVIGIGSRANSELKESLGIPKFDEL